MLCKLKNTSAKRMTSILRHVPEAFHPAEQGTILNSYRVIGIATNTQLVLNCALVTYIIMTAYEGLPNRLRMRGNKAWGGRLEGSCCVKT